MSLARALLHDPKILLLDEPFSNVDVHSAGAMVRLLAKTRTDGKTIFIVTHQASLLEGVADEFIWMTGGKIGRTHNRLNAAPGGCMSTGVTSATLRKDLRIEVAIERRYQLHAFSFRY